jgi:repressor LexA
MTTTGQRLRTLREQRGQSQEDIAKLIGVGRTTYLKYESNENKPTRKLKELSDLFGVTSDYIMCLSDNPHGESFAGQDGKHFLLFAGQQDLPAYSRTFRIPILGRVAAGRPSYVDEEIIGYTYIDGEYQDDGYEYFALIIKGQSMEPTIMDGDTVIVRKQDYIENGQIAIVLVDGEEATAKEVKETPEGIVLIGHNAAVYSPHFYSRQEIEELPVQIIGRVLQSIRKF